MNLCLSEGSAPAAGPFLLAAAGLSVATALELLKANLGGSGHLGRSWGHLGRSWGQVGDPGVKLEELGPKFGILKPIWELLGPSWRSRNNLKGFYGFCKNVENQRI